MSVDLLLTIGVLVGIFVVLIMDRLSADAAFIGGLVIVVIGGVIDLDRALQGFENSTLLALGSLYVVAAGLRATGALDIASSYVLGAEYSIRRLLLRMCPSVTVYSAFLLIHRRGVWDLPKGHRDPGEAIKTCARREVREEIGVDELHVLRALGTTQHGYVRNEEFVVKITYWFLMRTSERSFRPHRGEAIRRVAWARWSVAYHHLGYDTLRRHMKRVEADVREVLS